MILAKDTQLKGHYRPTRLPKGAVRGRWWLERRNSNWNPRNPKGSEIYHLQRHRHAGWPLFWCVSSYRDEGKIVKKRRVVAIHPETHLREVKS